MAADRLEIVALDEVPAGDVLALLDTCLGPGAFARDEAFWRWKHEENPFGRSVGLVATAAGRPVALRVFLRWRWAAGGHTVEALRAVDTATHPAWRRRGLFRRLTLELAERGRAEGAAFVFNTPNPRSRRGYLAMGWRDVCRLPLLVRPRRPVRALAAAVASRWKGGRGKEAYPWPGEGLGESLRPVGELLDDPALAGFLTAWAEEEGRLHTARSPEYLRWRYAWPPGAAYRASWHLEGASGAVVVARRRRRSGLTEVTLSELMASNDGVGRGAASEILTRLHLLPGADYLAGAGAARTPERRLLREAGWWPVPLGPRLVARPLRPSEPDPLEPAAWRLCVGDLELF